MIKINIIDYYLKLKQNENEIKDEEKIFKYHMAISYLEYELEMIQNSSNSFIKALEYFTFKEEFFNKTLKMAVLTNNLKLFISKLYYYKELILNKEIEDEFIKNFIYYCTLNNDVSDKDKLKILNKLIISCNEKEIISICLYFISLYIKEDKEIKKKYLKKSISIWNNNLVTANEMIKLGMKLDIKNIIKLIKLNSIDLNKFNIYKKNKKNLIENFSFIPLGGGHEVGKSCYLINIQDAKILLDVGIKLNGNVIEKPNFEFLIKNNLINDISALIITHAHLDHCGAIIDLYKLNKNIKLFLTKETKALIKLNLKEQMRKINELYELEEILEKAIILEFDEIFNITNNVSIKFYRAGHIIGASAVLIKSSVGNVFFTGDFCVVDQETVDGIDIPINEEIDVLITESTYGNKRYGNNSKLNKEMFKKYIENNIEKHKSVLIPAFAIGRSQEIIIMLKEIIEKRKFRIYIDGGCTYVTKLYNSLLKNNIDGNRIYYFQDRKRGSKKEFINEEVLNNPCCIVSSSGMLLEGSASCEYAKHMLENENCTCVLTGFQSANTIGEKLKEQLQFEKNKYINIEHKLYKIKCDIKEFNFSAHSDIYDILALEISLKAKYVILIHGEYKGEKREIENQLFKIPNLNIYQSKNNELIKLGED